METNQTQVCEQCHGSDETVDNLYGPMLCDKCLREKYTDQELFQLNAKKFYEIIYDTMYDNAEKVGADKVLCIPEHNFKKLSKVFVEKMTKFFDRMKTDGS